MVNTNNEYYFQGIRKSGRSLTRKISAVGYTKVLVTRKMGHMVGSHKRKVGHAIMNVILLRRKTGIADFRVI